MADFGIAYAATQDSIPPAELGPWAEAHGFESLWLGEHSHIPTSRNTPFQTGGEVPEYYKQLFDPFIALTAAAAVTSKLKLGTSVCLVAEHNAINLAKTVATLVRCRTGDSCSASAQAGMPRKWPITVLNSGSAGRSFESVCWR